MTTTKGIHLTGGANSENITCIKLFKKKIVIDGMFISSPLTIKYDSKKKAKKCYKLLVEMVSLKL